ncbi:MAG: transcriptional regulator [Rhizobiaceae bacterium]|nr:transcriptional regulator [Rhizobiaceae bacterium]
MSRAYRDACGTAHSLDLIGERWALLIMRELLLGPRRFGDLRADLPGLSANVLTQRLEGLEASGIVRRRRLPLPAAIQVYELTEWGLEAEPIILALGRWGARSPIHDPSMPLSAVSMMLSLRAMFDPEHAEGISVRIAFRLRADLYFASIRDRILIAGHGRSAATDAIVSGSPGAIVGVIYGLQRLEDAEKTGTVEISGDRAAFAEFCVPFDLPPKACPGGAAGG